MSLREKLLRFICPGCIQRERSRERHANTISILERSGESLDRISGEMQAIRERMANDPNPLLGEPPHRVKRREEPR